MQEPATEPTPSEPIRLEMSRNSKIGCTLIVLGGLLLIVLACVYARAKGRERAEQSVESLYASLGGSPPQWVQIEAIVTKSAEMTLRKAATLHGQVSAWHISKTETGLTGRPTTVFVEVTRNGKQYVDLLATLDNRRIAVVVEYPKEDFEKGREDRAIRQIAKPTASQSEGRQ